MVQIAIFNAKGGTGKTTITDEVCFFLEREGVPVQVADLDGQGGLLHETGPRAGAAVTVVDMPGQPGRDDQEIMAESDVVIVPMINSPRDRKPTADSLELIKRSGSKAMVILVINHWRSRTKQDRDFARGGMREWLNGLARRGLLPEIPVVKLLPDSVAFPRAAELGKSVVDTYRGTTAGTATQELCEAVWSAAKAESIDEYKQSMADRDDQWTLVEHI